MLSPVDLGGYPHEVISAAAVYKQAPGARPEQITNFNQLEVGMRVVLMGPGRLVTYDPERTSSSETVTHGSDVYAEDLTIAALYARLSGGFSLGFGPKPSKYSRLVPDSQSLVAFGVGEGTGGYQGGTARSLLTLTQADLGIKPYTVADTTLGWSVFYLRHAQPDEPLNYETYERRLLSPQEVVAHIPNTRLLT